MGKRHRRVVSNLAVTLAILLLLVDGHYTAPRSNGQAGCEWFEDTGQLVCGRFLTYWKEHGGLPQQGYPISTELKETSLTDGKTYTVQYFERAVFELHPENGDSRFQVLLALLGSFEKRRRYGDKEPPNQRPSTNNATKFSETGKSLGGVFRRYWETHGGLAQQGLPITDEFEERSCVDGRTRTVQYFERAVFELHPESRSTGHEVQLSLLGQFRHDLCYDSPTRLLRPPNTSALRGLAGTIAVDGSSTVYPITQAAADEFGVFAPRVNVEVLLSGTTGGFRRFCNGEVDIANASRPIELSEARACAERGVSFVELPVAYDGLAVVVNKNNSFVDRLTTAELKKIWEPVAERRITRWSQVRRGFPDVPLQLFGPDRDSGTFDYFTGAVVGRSRSSRNDYEPNSDDDELVQRVRANAGALGYFGLSYYEKNKDKLRLVPIDSGDGRAVLPTAAAVRTGAYHPLSRPLFIYVNSTAAERAEVQAFAEFYLSQSFTPLIESDEIGSIALTNSLYRAVQRRFGARTTGTLFHSGGPDMGVLANLDCYSAQ